MKAFKKIRALFALIIYYLKSLVIANIRVAIDILRPGHQIQPGFIVLPMKVKTDFEIMMFAHLLMMTPGTMCLDISPDRKWMHIHAIDLKDTEALKKELSEGLEKRILEVLR